MSRVDAWLAARSPEPPADLAEALSFDDTQGPLEEVLTAVALTRLGWAEGHTGRVRESAYRLLEADALLTYACEAALDSADPDAALRRVLVAVGG